MRKALEAGPLAETAVFAKPRWVRRKTVQRALTRAVALLVALAGSVLYLIPLVWMVSASLSTNAEVLSYPTSWIPKRILLSNFPKAFEYIKYWMYVRNTVIITVAATMGALFSSSIVAYGFARLRARLKDVLFLVLLATMMLPIHVRLVPIYLIWRKLEMIDTYAPLIVPAWLGGGPFFIFLLRQFYATLPPALDDAAKIDGCSYLGTWWRIVLPLSKPALATVAIFSFFGHWNNFLGPLIYLNDPDKYTLALGLRFFQTDYGITEWNLMMAGTLVAVLPPLAIFFFAQKTFVQGIVMTGIKG